jgi:DNA-binding response OmpR family regulator
MRVLVVEDEEKLGNLIKDILAKEGFAVDWMADGEKAQRRIQLNYNDYDLIVLDLMLPNKQGLEIVKDMRDSHIDTPLLILSGKQDTDSKVALLNAGADDYLTKPFEFDELMSRIRAITRRPKKVLPTELKVADLTLNPATQKVIRENEEVKLTLKEFRILEYFMRNPDTVLSREDIMSNIWDFNYDSFSNVLDVFINKIRNKLDTKGHAKLIETVRGVGYRLNSNV